jgi:hypothetical protein
LERPAGGASGKAAASRKRGKLVTIGAGVAVLAVGAAGAMWMWSQPTMELSLPPQHAEAPAVARLGMPAAPASAVDAVAAAPAPVPAATIVEDSAALGALAPAAPPSRAVPARDELTAALERPHTTPAPAPAKAKLAEHKKVEKPARKPVQVAKKTEPGSSKAKPSPQDSDVTLLAALMAHVQPSRPAKGSASPADQLKQCGRMNEAGAAQCRERLCATTARKEAECKQQPVAVKTASES